ncbi:MAG: lysyl-tRNA synthetase class 2, partial [Candidatus Paceibacteria bacterium]
SGDDEAMMPDWEFVEMLEHGMPPTCGFGFGERLFSFWPARLFVRHSCFH